jgi:hypothetical protein
MPTGWTRFNDLDDTFPRGVSTKEGAGSWEVNFLLSDHLGSTSTTVDSSGVLIADLRYKPWGSKRYAWGQK